MRYVIVDRVSGAIDWDCDLHATRESAIDSMCGPNHMYVRSPEEVDHNSDAITVYWADDYDICEVRTLLDGRKIETPNELATLQFGTVIASPNYVDAMSIVPGTAYRGTPNGYLLMNVATTHKAQIAEYPGFLPAYVVFEHEFAK